MDPILAFCIKHPECDVSFVGYDWSGIRDQVKIDMCRIVDRVPYRAARIVDTIDNLEKALDEMYKELVDVEKRNRGTKWKKIG